MARSDVLTCALTLLAVALTFLFSPAAGWIFAFLAVAGFVAYLRMGEESPTDTRILDLRGSYLDAPVATSKAATKVVVVRYGPASGGHPEGLHLENYGDVVFEAQPEPLILGKLTVTFSKIATLKKKGFSGATIDYGGSGCTQLDPAWIKAANDQADFDGELVLGVRYRHDEKWYRCVYKFERNVSVRGTCPFEVTTLRQESC